MPLVQRYETRGTSKGGQYHAIDRRLPYKRRTWFYSAEQDFIKANAKLLWDIALLARFKASDNVTCYDAVVNYIGYLIDIILATYPNAKHCMQLFFDIRPGSKSLLSSLSRVCASYHKQEAGAVYGAFNLWQYMRKPRTRHPH